MNTNKNCNSFFFSVDSMDILLPDILSPFLLSLSHLHMNTCKERLEQKRLLSSSKKSELTRMRWRKKTPKTKKYCSLFYEVRGWKGICLKGSAFSALYIAFWILLSNMNHPICLTESFDSRCQI